MDKSDSHRRKKFKVPKPDSNVSTSHKWTIFVIFLSFVLSLVFSLITSVAMQSLNLFFAFIVLFAIIAINILFDMIGTAVQSAEEKPFHSLAARKVKGARESISVIRHAPQLANLCCDVIGDSKRTDNACKYKARQYTAQVKFCDKFRNNKSCRCTGNNSGNIADYVTA